MLRPVSTTVRPARLAAGSVLAAGAALAVLAAQTVWVVRRRLPTLDGHDASGVVPVPRGGGPLRLVVLGDSTLTGPGLTSPEEIWLRRALADLELTCTVQVVSLAVGGSRVADVHRRVPDALAEHPDLVVMAVGSNDAIHGTPAARFGRELDQVLAELLAEVPVVAVGNVGDLGNVARVPRPLSSVLRRRARAVCHEVERVVARHDGAVLLDVTPTNDGFREPAVFAADLFHPNRRGHELWAAAARPGLHETFCILGAAHPARGPRPTDRVDRPDGSTGELVDPGGDLVAG